MSEDNWVEVGTATTNRTPDSNVDIFLDLDKPPICHNMTNQEFRRVIMKVRDAAVTLVKDRIAAQSKWDVKERERATYYFGRADEEIRSTLARGLPKLLSALQELVPEKIVRWDDALNKSLSCSITPDSGQNRASVCKPDSEKRVIAIYSSFCTDSNGWLWRFSKVKTLIHECTHYTDTFNSDDVIYADSAIGAHIFALNNADKAIRNADSITGYIATFDREVAQ
ncbi:M35 family metallo-endopeptidase [Caballeronia sp. SBC2]|uniref:M35 family metallo-endopeptidase n=1 Tax=Caballeronia sp. SBC2 TaxID=2705547 RepID=UPI0013E174EE|nr:M35 family metallo-endopeptidase [Caballeronia sp. SBC2]QIE22680.1 Lysine-specific metallo-endopeptidase [Caballeronia sp. SBC2]